MAASPSSDLTDTKLEYMALGKPIVASRLAQIGEILADGVTARLVTPGDVADLANGIVDVLNSPDRGSGLGRAARSRQSPITRGTTACAPYWTAFGAAGRYSSQIEVRCDFTVRN